MLAKEYKQTVIFTYLKCPKLCRYKLHFLSDEIYGLSVFDDAVPFTSVLAMGDLPDPDRTHFTWGIGKASSEFLISPSF